VATAVAVRIALEKIQHQLFLQQPPPPQQPRPPQLLQTTADANLFYAFAHQLFRAIRSIGVTQNDERVKIFASEVLFAFVGGTSDTDKQARKWFGMCYTTYKANPTKEEMALQAQETIDNYTAMGYISGPSDEESPDPARPPPPTEATKIELPRS
jgi:hypothetical protein